MPINHRKIQPAAPRSFSWEGFVFILSLRIPARFCAYGSGCTCAAVVLRFVFVMTPKRILPIIALVLVLLAMFGVAPYPFIPIAVAVLAVAMLL